MRFAFSRFRRTAWVSRSFILLSVTITVHAGDWQKYESDHLTVYSDCAPGRAKSLIRQFAAFQHAARTLLAPPNAPFPHTTLIYFNDQKDLQKYCPPFEPLAGQDSKAWHTNIPLGRNRLIATASADNMADCIANIYRIEAKILPSWYDASTPPWLRLAMGAALANMHWQQNVITFSGFDRGQRTVLKQKPWLDWSLVLDPGIDSVADQDPKGTLVQSAQLSLLIDWLLFGTGQQPGTGYFALLEALRTDHPNAVAALESGIGMDCGQLNERLREHMKQPASIRTLRFDGRAFDDGLLVTPATAQEIHLQFFHLQAGRPPTHQNARHELDLAIGAGSDTAALKYAQAIYAQYENDPPAAARFLQQAIAVGTRDPSVYLLAAQIRLIDQTYALSPYGRLAPVSSNAIANVSSDQAQAAINEIQTALKLDPLNRSAYGLLAQAISKLPAVTREHAGMLSPALSVHPQGLQIRYCRGLTYRRAGLLAAADADFDYLTRQHPESPEARLVLEWRQGQASAKTLAETQGAFDRFVEEKRYDEAIEILRPLLAAEQNPTMKRQYEKQIASLREKVAWTTLLDLFHEKRWDEADKAATAFIANYPRSHLLPGARRMQEETRRNL